MIPPENKPIVTRITTKCSVGIWIVFSGDLVVSSALDFATTYGLKRFDRNNYLNSESFLSPKWALFFKS